VQEESDLAQRIQEGDQGALETLIKANLRFVVAVANRYQGCGLPLPDLISEGNLGLITRIQIHHLRRLVDSAIHFAGAGQARPGGAPAFASLE
jgi:DNA-directed RNA polymerase sigma subunit (sigma70/sigma32)